MVAFFVASARPWPAIRLRLTPLPRDVLYPGGLPAIQARGMCSEYRVKAAGIDRSLRCLTKHRPWPRLSAALEPLARDNTARGLCRGGSHPHAPGPIVVELDPRLTTAYVGLAEALDINAAAAILGVFDQGLAPAPCTIGTGRKAVEVSTTHHLVTTPHP